MPATIASPGAVSCGQFMWAATIVYFDFPGLSLDHAA